MVQSYGFSVSIGHLCLRNRWQCAVGPHVLAAAGRARDRPEKSHTAFPGNDALLGNAVFAFGLSEEPVLHDGLSLWGQHTLGMELYAVDVVVLVAQAHDAAVVAHRRHIQTFGEACAVDHP